MQTEYMNVLIYFLSLQLRFDVYLWAEITIACGNKHALQGAGQRQGAAGLRPTLAGIRILHPPYNRTIDGRRYLGQPFVHH